MKLRRWMVPGILAFALAPRGGGAQEKEDPTDPRFRELLTAVGKSYTTYGKVEDVLRFAPALCAAPAPIPIRRSASQDPATHGRKLYFLYAWDAALYLKKPQKDHFKSAEKTPLYEGKSALQVLVKESWSSVKVEEKEGRPAEGELRGPESRVLTQDGQTWRAGEKGELFIMVQLGEGAQGTDQGWVYGTVSADLKKVTSAGRVQSCMACHESAGAGRLFGLPGPKTAQPPAGKN